MALGANCSSVARTRTPSFMFHPVPAESESTLFSVAPAMRPWYLTTLAVCVLLWGSRVFLVVLARHDSSAVVGARSSCPVVPRT